MYEYYSTEILPYALQYGMTVEQFWHDDADLIIAYHKAYYRRLHTEAHAQGFYGFVALSTALGNAFRKKGEKAREYPRKPEDPFKEKATKKTLYKARERAKAQISWLNSMSNN